MIEQVTQIHLFYPLLTLILIVLIVTIGIVVIKCKDNGLFNNIFNRHADEHEYTTDKMANMHDNIIPLKYTSIQEKELHSLETGLKELQDNVSELKEKVNELFDRIMKIENTHK